MTQQTCRLQAAQPLTKRGSRQRLRRRPNPPSKRRTVQTTISKALCRDRRERDERERRKGERGLRGDVQHHRHRRQHSTAQHSRSVRSYSSEESNLPLISLSNCWLLSDRTRSSSLIALLRFCSSRQRPSKRSFSFVIRCNCATTDQPDTRRNVSERAVSGGGGTAAALTTACVPVCVSRLN
jgi:hypothetical protein